MRLLDTWASRIPTRASVNKPGLNPSARTASRPATAPAVSVIGSTAARVSTSHLDTTSR